MPSARTACRNVSAKSGGALFNAICNPAASGETYVGNYVCANCWPARYRSISSCDPSPRP